MFKPVFILIAFIPKKFNRFSNDHKLIVYTILYIVKSEKFLVFEVIGHQKDNITAKTRLIRLSAAAFFSLQTDRRSFP